MIPARHIVCEVSSPLEMSAAAADLGVLRSAFAELSDRAAKEVQRAGLDLDDVLLERSALVRFGTGKPRWQAVDFVSDPSLFVRDVIRKAAVEMLQTPDLSDVGILGVRVTALADGQ